MGFVVRACAQRFRPWKLYFYKLSAIIHNPGTEVEDGIRCIICLSTVPDEAIYKVTQRIAHQLPVLDFDLHDSEPFVLELFRDHAKSRFICCRQPLNNFIDYLKRIDSY